MLPGSLWRWWGAMKWVCWLFVACSNVKTPDLTGWRSLVNKQFFSPSLSAVFQWIEASDVWLQCNVTVHVRTRTFILLSISFYRTQYQLLGFIALWPFKCVFFSHSIDINLSTESSINWREQRGNLFTKNHHDLKKGTYFPSGRYRAQNCLKDDFRNISIGSTFNLNMHPDNGGSDSWNHSAKWG